MERHRADRATRRRRSRGAKPRQSIPAAAAARAPVWLSSITMHSAGATPSAAAAARKRSGAGLPRATSWWLCSRPATVSSMPSAPELGPHLDVRRVRRHAPWHAKLAERPQRFRCTRDRFHLALERLHQPVHRAGPSTILRQLPPEVRFHQRHHRLEIQADEHAFGFRRRDGPAEPGEFRGDQPVGQRLAIHDHAVAIEDHQPQRHGAARNQLARRHAACAPIHGQSPLAAGQVRPAAKLPRPGPCARARRTRSASAAMNAGSEFGAGARK